MTARMIEGLCPCGRALPRLRKRRGSCHRLPCRQRRPTRLGRVPGDLRRRPPAQSRPGADPPGSGGEVLYRIRPSHDFAAADDLTYLEETSRQYLGDTVTVRWELVEELPCEPSGKFLFSRSTVVPAFLAGERVSAARRAPGRAVPALTQGSDLFRVLHLNETETLMSQPWSPANCSRRSTRGPLCSSDEGVDDSAGWMSSFPSGC